METTGKDDKVVSEDCSGKDLAETDSLAVNSGDGKASPRGREDNEDPSADREGTLRNIGIASGAAEVVGRYGEAGGKYVSAYTGHDYDVDRTFKRSLKKISSYRLSDNDSKRNLKQQAGFAAETVYTADRTAEQVIKGQPGATMRADDVTGYSTNDTRVDIVVVDGKGNAVPGTGAQMKIVAKPENVIDGIANGKLARYRGLDLLLPSDLCEQAKKHCQARHNELVEQAMRLIKDGKKELAAQKLAKAKQYLETKARIKSSGLTIGEAEFARLHPILFTAERIAKISHRAGLETMGCSALIGGVVSLVSNIKAVVVDGEKTMAEAAVDVLADTGKGAAVGYGTGFVGAGAGAILGQSKTSVLRSVGKSSLPAMMATMALESALLFKKLLSGEIGGADFLEGLGEKGTSFWSGAAMGAVGQAVIPIPVVGAVLGGMVGSALSSVLYNGCLSAFKEARESESSYLAAKKRCEESRENLAVWREESGRRFRLYFRELETGLQGCLDDMSSLLAEGDLNSKGMDALAACVCRFSEMLEKPLRIGNFAEFEAVLDSGGPIVI